MRKNMIFVDMWALISVESPTHMNLIRHDISICVEYELQVYDAR